ncbi:MAG: asparagine synthase (glutamine-hydrolyzing) [Ginsengibacter sp.]
MCGLAGIVYKNKERKVDPSLLKKMGDALIHRGPDDEGIYYQNNVGLAFRRLSIIDVSTGHQPFANNDKSVHIVFNGEIYNFPELKIRLQQKGYTFKSNSDTEVILKLYLEYGHECLSYLEGMFAFAIWDSNKQQLFCARDRFGIKPFYYYQDNEKFTFGSEIKAIIQDKDVDKTISPEALDSYFAYGYIISDISIYKNIKKLSPAHYLVLSFRDHVKVEIKKYWDVDFTPDYTKSESYWIQKIEESFSETIRKTMISDVPIGAFLSGGIDSGSVVAMMAKHSTQPIKTFSIGFKEHEFNELKNAREIAKLYGCDHHEEIVEPESINLLPKLVQAYDEPFADASAIPTYYVSKLARQFVKVALSGDGGDELFVGYTGYSKFNKINSIPIIFNNPFFNKMIYGNIRKLLPDSTKGKGLLYLLSQNKKHSYAHITTFSPKERNRLLHKNSLPVGKKNAEDFKTKILNKNIDYDYITNLQYLDIQTYMVDNILTKVDRASMMNSLEVRVPFLDHKFAELSFKIPLKMKFKMNVKKHILKKAMKNYLPEKILHQPKKGFGVPLSSWINGNLKEYVHDTLLSSRSLLSDHLDRKFIKEVVVNHQKGQRDFQSKIWSLLVYEEWLKQNK